MPELSTEKDRNCRKKTEEGKKVFKFNDQKSKEEENTAFSNRQV